MTRKLYSVPLVLAILALGFASCNRNASSLFDRELLLAGISDNIEHFRNNPDYDVFPTGPLTSEDAGQLPAYWYMAQNDEIVIAFFPEEGELGESISYRLQFISLLQNTDRHFLGRHVGMRSQEIIRRYGRPDHVEEIFQHSHIFYYNADRSQFVRFWLGDDVVIRAGWAYTLSQDGNGG